MGFHIKMEQFYILELILDFKCDNQISKISVYEKYFSLLLLFVIFSVGLVLFFLR